MVDSETEAFLRVYDEFGQEAENLTVGDLVKIEISVTPSDIKVTLKNCFVHGADTGIPIIQNGQIISPLEGAIDSIRLVVQILLSSLYSK